MVALIDMIGISMLPGTSPSTKRYVWEVLCQNLSSGAWPLQQVVYEEFTCAQWCAFLSVHEEQEGLKFLAMGPVTLNEPSSNAHVAMFMVRWRA